jgi:calcium-dependent protein kinase
MISLFGLPEGPEYRPLHESMDSDTRIRKSPICSCGRESVQIVDRDLVVKQACCTKCLHSMATEHDVSCTSTHPKRSPNTADSNMKVADRAAGVASALQSLIGEIPSVDSDMDPASMKALVDALCSEYGLPRIDEKRFLLSFSRFAPDGILYKGDSKKFFYMLFKRVFTLLDVRNAKPPMCRYFVVLRNTDVYKFYRFKSVVGHGSFGVVHRVIHVVSGQTRVCKSIQKNAVSIPLSQLEAEIRIISQLDHPNVVRLYEFFEDEKHIHLIMENCRGGDLMSCIKQSIKDQKPLSRTFVKSVLRQLLYSLSYLRNQRVVHKDLKPENIMLQRCISDPDCVIVKVIDFGLSEMFSNSQKGSLIVSGTAFYMAPELFKPPFDYKCDIWSVGVIGFFMLTGFLPFFGSSVSEVKSNVLYRKLQWPSTFAGGSMIVTIEHGEREFVEALLEKDSHVRPHASDALRMDWIHYVQSGDSDLFSVPVALNIFQFSRLSWVRRCLILIVAHIWEDSRFTVLRDIFSTIDSSSRGTISVHELADRIGSLEITQSLDAWKAAASIDLAGTGQITYTMFSAACIVPLLNDNHTVLRALFDVFSPNQRGKISSDSVWGVLSGAQSAFNIVNNKFSADDFNRELRMDLARRGSPLSLESQSISRNASESRTKADLSMNYNEFRVWLLSE